MSKILLARRVLLDRLRCNQSSTCPLFTFQLLFSQFSHNFFCHRCACTCASALEDFRASAEQNFFGRNFWIIALSTIVIPITCNPKDFEQFSLLPAQHSRLTNLYEINVEWWLSFLRMCKRIDFVPWPYPSMFHFCPTESDTITPNEQQKTTNCTSVDPLLLSLPSTCESQPFTFNNDYNVIIFLFLHSESVRQWLISVCSTTFFYIYYI
jgi:hypothetical protein